MSGLVKSIGKIFKKVFNVVKKVAFPLLAIGAIVFTGGAALGLAPLAGGWGGAVASGLSSLGISTGGTLGSILTGAVTQAGTGAAIGGLTSLASGGKFQDGAAAGGTIGAVTGGVMGSGLLGGAAKTAGGVTMSARNAPTGLMPGATTTGTAPAISNPAALEGAATGGAATSGPAGLVSGAANAAAPATSGGLLSRVLTSPVAGQVIGGLGQGLMTGMAAKEQAQADEDEQRRVTGSYNVDPSAYDQAAADPTPRPTPNNKWGRRGRASYNPQTGRIEYV